MAVDSRNPNKIDLRHAKFKLDQIDTATSVLIGVNEKDGGPILQIIEPCQTDAEQFVAQIAGVREQRVVDAQAELVAAIEAFDAASVLGDTEEKVGDRLTKAKSALEALQAAPELTTESVETLLANS
ncbi:MAG: hypothetical protein JHC87_01800 [Thermoleophilaceae bacterium]|nr:hypothetical protein [Thermoleophilaceae bacterium]